MSLWTVLSIMAATDLFHNSHHNSGSWLSHHQLGADLLMGLEPKGWATYVLDSTTLHSHKLSFTLPGVYTQDTILISLFFSEMSPLTNGRGEVLAKQSAVPEQLVWAGSDLTNTTISSFLLLTTKTSQNSSKHNCCSYWKKQLILYIQIKHLLQCTIQNNVQCPATCLL